MDARLARMADVLVQYSLDVQEDDVVIVAGPLSAAAFVLALQTRILAAGGHSHLRLAPDELDESLLRLGNVEQLEWINPNVRQLFESADCYLSLFAPTNTRALTEVDAEAGSVRRRARRELFELLEERQHANELRSVVAALPSHGLAQEASMSIGDYTELIVGAGQLDADDPVAVWRAFRTQAANLADRLNRASSVRIEADGTDLVLGVENRAWVPADGRQNFPDGEVYTAPLDGSTAGTIRFPHATLIEGRRIEGVELTFDGGVVTEARADRGDADLQALLATDEGARRVGEVALGLNDRIDRFTGEALFDEKILGTVHVALGAAYPECGGTNRSALHWDLVCDLRTGGSFEVDGVVAQQDGAFVDGWF